MTNKELTAQVAALQAQLASSKRKPSIGSIWGQSLGFITQGFNATESVMNIVERTAREGDLVNAQWAKEAQDDRDEINAM